MEKKLILYTFNILAHVLSFSLQIIHLKIVDVYSFWKGRGSKKVRFVHSFKCWQLWTALYTDSNSYPGFADCFLQYSLWMVAWKLTSTAAQPPCLSTLSNIELIICEPAEDCDKPTVCSVVVGLDVGRDGTKCCASELSGSKAGHVGQGLSWLVQDEGAIACPVWWQYVEKNIHIKGLSIIVNI